MVVSMEHIASTLIMSTTIIRLFQWKWEYIVATLGTNPYVYKVQSLSWIFEQLILGPQLMESKHCHFPRLQGGLRARLRGAPLLCRGVALCSDGPYPVTQVESISHNSS